MRASGVTSVPRTDRVIKWLVDGDPAIRWQVLRDLAGAAESTVERERRKSSARWLGGARLLAKQDPEGTWAGGLSSDGGLYSPKWISTTYTMLLLRDFGLPAMNRQARRACTLLLDGGFQRDGGLNYGVWAKWTGGSETCVTGMGLSILSSSSMLTTRLDTIASHLLEQQMPDGGWNCRRPHGATHASVHTTISVLEGCGSTNCTVGANSGKCGPHSNADGSSCWYTGFFRSHRTGEIIKPAFIRFSFPPRWHYDICAPLDYFQAVNAACDPRMADAIDVVRNSQRKDGRWPLQHSHKGKTYFELEHVGAPSRWNTLRALRVINWWERGTVTRPR